MFLRAPSERRTGQAPSQPSSIANLTPNIIPGVLAVELSDIIQRLFPACDLGVGIPTAHTGLL